MSERRRTRAGVTTNQLHGVAGDALDDHLRAELLREMSRDEAVRHLKTIGGIGAFSAELILIRVPANPPCAPPRAPACSRHPACLRARGKPASEQM